MSDRSLNQRRVHRFPWGTTDQAQVLIVDCGSKSMPMIAQLLREIGLCSQTVHASMLAEVWAKVQAGERVKPRLVILSGGDQSVYDPDTLTIEPALFQMLKKETVLLGICYGAQLLAQLCGGKVERALHPEFGVMRLLVQPGFHLGEYEGGDIVMNHRDEITVLPSGWRTVGSTRRCKHALVGSKKIWAAQFHPEMDHTEYGNLLLHALAFDVAGCTPDYVFDPETFVQQVTAWFDQLPVEGSILCGLSGGVDSAVADRLARRSQRVRERLQSIFIDNGFMRENELEEVRTIFGSDRISYVDARDVFYHAVELIPYPSVGSILDQEHDYYDQVRKTIGREFILAFLRATRDLTPVPGALIQGTNCADVVESTTGLKAHHNVGGLPAELGVDIIEPLAGLYKMEIRKLAAHLDLPEEIVFRQPFPGPGLALRTVGRLTRDTIKVLQRANAILEEVVRTHYPVAGDRPCQYYVAVLPVPTTGLMGDNRVMGFMFLVRMVTSAQRESYATLGVFRPSIDFEREITHRLVSEVTMPDGTPFVRVVYEWTGKPPSTTELH